MDTKSMITAGQLKSDCADMEIRASNGALLKPDIPVWLDPTSCNTAKTFIWMKISSLAAGTTLRLRIISGSGVSKAILTTNSSKDVFDIFNGFDTINTVLFEHSPDVPSTYSSGGLEMSAMSSTKRSTRFTNRIERPYVIEAAANALSDCTSHTMYVADTILATPDASSCDFSFDSSSVPETLANAGAI